MEKPVLTAFCFTDIHDQQAMLDYPTVLRKSYLTAAENAVLPYVLRRGTKSLPDMRRISERLDALYGAEIEPSVRKRGEQALIPISEPTRPD